MKKPLKLTLCIVACELAGASGAIFTATAINGWYAAIQKPPFNPPNWIFAPVWTFLFFLMGVSLYLILEKDLKDRIVKSALMIFIGQFILNIAWSFLFFGLQKPFDSFLEIIVLWFAILLMIIQFNKIDKKAAFLMIPYLLWVSFAAFLNLSVWIMNINL
jgi:benzodiazapine receptor